MPSLFFINNKHQHPAEEYRRCLLAAIIQAAGGETVEIKGSLDPKQRHDDQWLRDMVTVIAEKKLILTSTRGCPARLAMQQALVTAIQHRDPDYRSLEVNAYFEGGHVFYIPGKQILLHGNDLGGHYQPAHGYRSYYLDEQTHQLANALALEGLEVLGVQLSPTVKAQLAHNQLNDYVYHLDCFMQVMPDGKVLILNSAILAKDSLARLQQALGDSWIDLAYEDYLTRPILFNFLTIPYQQRWRILSNRLPASLYDQLTHLGYELITPETFLPLSPRYHEAFNQATLKALRQVGYTKTVDSTSLLCNPAQKNSGEARLSTLLGHDAFELFNPGLQGGLHCLALDVPEIGRPKAPPYFGHLHQTAPKIFLPTQAQLFIQLFHHHLEETDAIGFLSLCLQTHHDQAVQQQLLTHLLNEALRHSSSQYDPDGLSIDTLQDLKNQLPGLRTEIDRFITEHKAFFFLTTLKPQRYPVLQHLSLDEALGQATCVDHIARIYQHFIQQRQGSDVDSGIDSDDDDVDPMYLQALEDHVQANLPQLIHMEYDKRRLSHLFPKLTHLIEATPIPVTFSPKRDDKPKANRELAFYRCLFTLQQHLEGSEAIKTLQQQLNHLRVESQAGVHWFMPEPNPPAPKPPAAEAAQAVATTCCGWLGWPRLNNSASWASACHLSY